MSCSTFCKGNNIAVVAFFFYFLLFLFVCVRIGCDVAFFYVLKRCFGEVAMVDLCQWTFCVAMIESR